LLVLGIVAVLAVIPVFWFSYAATEDLEVYYLDIGQGDATLIKTPFGQNILIDGGPDDKIISELSDSLPWWDKNIDLMVLTHPHDDHVAGLIDVIKRYNVKRILYTGVVHTSPYYIEWLQLVRDYNIPMVIIDRPQKIILNGVPSQAEDDKCYLDVLYPRESLLGKTVENLNNSSIVMKLVYGETSFLFTGDAELEVEEELTSPRPSPFEGEGASTPPPTPPLDRGGESSRSVDLSADVFQAGHHGSDTSNSQEFLEAVFTPPLSSPYKGEERFFIIQVGKDNDFGHPSRRVIKRVERLGARVFRNDLDGTVRLVSNGQTITYNP